MYLIMKTSPKKFDLNTINDQIKKLNTHYLNKKTDHRISKTDEVYYKYNILYGTNSNEVLRSYSPKMRPLSSAFPKSIALNEDRLIFSPDEVFFLYEAKCKDLKLKKKDKLENKFLEYCNKKCINRKVDFTESNLGQRSSEVLARLVNNNEKISELIMTKNNLGDLGVTELMKAIKDSMYLVHLDLSSNDITPKGGEVIFDAIKDNKSLISLNLNSLDGVNRNRVADSVKKLESILKINKFLEFLSLRGNGIRNEGFKSIILGLNTNTTLLCLDVSNNDITSAGVAYFNSILTSSKLTDLNISDNPIGNDGIAIIAENMSKPSLNQIKRLNFSNCNLSFSGVLNFYTIVHLSKKLEYLNFSNNDLSSQHFSKIKHFIGLQCLEELYLSKCSIGNEGAIAVAEGALNWNTLKVLDISDNKIDDKGFMAFQMIPETNSSLTHFDVSKNSITDISAYEFIKSLTYNPKLKSINFYDNQLKNDCGTALIEVLRSNKNITQINLKFNRVQNRIVEEIQKMLKSNSMISKQKYIPNLKKEIRNIFITKDDFDQTDAKIIETGNNIKMLVDKTKDESMKYNTLKIEEKKLLDEIDERNNNLNAEYKDLEELIRKMNHDLKLMQMSHNVHVENLTKEISSLNESVKSLKKQGLDIKITSDRIKADFEADHSKVKSDVQFSEKKLTIAMLSVDSLKKELENKKILLESLEKNQDLETNNELPNVNKKSIVKRSTLTKKKSIVSGVTGNENKLVKKNSTLAINKDKTPVKTEVEVKDQIKDQFEVDGNAITSNKANKDTSNYKDNVINKIDENQEKHEAPKINSKKNNKPKGSKEMSSKSSDKFKRALP